MTTRTGAVVCLLPLLGCPRPAATPDVAAAQVPGEPEVSVAPEPPGVSPDAPPPPVSVDAAVLSTDLVPGVVLDEAKGRAFVMSDSGIVAVEVATGKHLWETSRAIKPLALDGGSLLVIGAKNEHGGIAVLDADTGEVSAACARPPSPPTQFAIFNGLGVNVSSSGLWVDERPVLTWLRTTHYAGGMAPTEEMLRRSQSRASGSVVVAPATGCSSAVETPTQHIPPMFRLQAPPGRQGPWRVGGMDVTLETRDHDGIREVLLHRERDGVAVGAPVDLGGAPINTRYAAHGRDWRSLLLTTQRRTDAGPFLYDARWVALATGGPVDFGALPWVPYGQARIGDVLVTAGPGVVGGVGIDGAMIWSVPVRQTGYTGPYPP